MAGSYLLQAWASPKTGDHYLTFLNSQADNGLMTLHSNSLLLRTSSFIFVFFYHKMIAFLTGKFVYKTPAVVHVDVNGVGYEVQVSLNTYSKISGLEVGTLYTYLQVKEDGHTLYGFFDTAEKAMFVQIIGINGVGAATARMMLSSMHPGDLAKAILTGNIKQLESIKGIGRKTAERIVLELKDKLNKNFGETSSSALIYNSLEQDALNALVALGIARNTAENAIKKASASAPSDENLEQLIKKALQFI